MFRKFKVLLFVMVILVIAGGAYGFAAANSVPTTKVGDGIGVVSGYTITGIEYSLNATNPTTLDSVKFDIGAVAATGKVKVQLVEASSTWYDCVVVDTSTVWTCATTGLVAKTIDQVRVVAASN